MLLYVFVNTPADRDPGLGFVFLHVIDLGFISTTAKVFCNLDFQ